MYATHHEAAEELHRINEGELIEKMKNGEMYAFDEIARRYKPKILAQLKKLCHNESEAEDVFQDIMVTLYLKLGTFEGKSTLSTWIYRVTLNAFLMNERKQKRRQLFFIDEEPFDTCQDSFAQHSESDSLAYATMVNNEFQSNLARAVSDLPKGYRDVFLMRNHEELPIKEVSRRLGISVPAVKSRNRRARQFLRSRLEQYQVH